MEDRVHRSGTERTQRRHYPLYLELSQQHTFQDRLQPQHTSSNGDNQVIDKVSALRDVSDQFMVLHNRTHPLSPLRIGLALPPEQFRGMITKVRLRLVGGPLVRLCG